MTLQLSGKNENLSALLRAQLGKEAYQKLAPKLQQKLQQIYGVHALGLEPYSDFYGQPRVQMPLLVSGKDEKGKVVDVPRDPISFAYVLERRMGAPKNVKEAWRKNYIFTGDGSIAGTEGDHLIVFDDQALREMTPESELYNGALVLSVGAWQKLKSEILKDDSKGAYLSAEEVEEAHGEGYVKNNGVWTPANRSVAKAWDALSKGRDLTSYVQQVSQASHDSDKLLNVYFNKTTKDGKPTARSWVADRFDFFSGANGGHNLDLNDSLLIGVVPEKDVEREKVLEALVQSYS